MEYIYFPVSVSFFPASVLSPIKEMPVKSHIQFYFPVQRPPIPGTFDSLRGSDPAKPYGSPRVPEPHPGEPGQQHQHFAMQVRNIRAKLLSEHVSL